MAKHGASEGTGTIAALARAVLAFEHEAIAAPVLEQAQLLLLDTIGCGLAGANDDVTHSVRETVLPSSGTPQCALIGSTAKTALLDAVLVNGAAVRVLDWNDYIVGESQGQPELGGHPSDNIPAALAVGEARRRSGRDVLAAIVAGYEIHARLQRLMDRAGAWDGVTASGLVAPAIAGRLMGLSEEQLAHALALGLARAPTPAIVRSGHLSSAKALSNALVAQSGVQAALFAEQGLTGPLGILDEPRGLRDLFGHADIATLTAPIPPDGAVMRAHVKAYPCVNTAQSAVAAALQLRSALGGKTDSLARIDIVMADYPIVKRQQEDPARLHPASRESADHSFPFVVAAALSDGAFGLAQYENERWRDPTILALMAKMEMRRDAAWNTRAPGTYPCAIRAWDGDGREHRAEVPYPPGFSRGGLDRSAVIEKFHAVTASVIGAQARERIVDAAMEFAHSPSTARLEAAVAIEERVN